jgi:hypothetical protein
MITNLISKPTRPPGISLEELIGNIGMSLLENWMMLTIIAEGYRIITFRMLRKMLN